MPKNKCTCPAAVDITCTGHLPDCPQPGYERRREALSSRRQVRQQLAIVRRQLTFARKRVRQLERERNPAAVRVVRHARRWVRHASDWNLRQLKLAVQALEQSTQCA